MDQTVQQTISQEKATEKSTTPKSKNDENANVTQHVSNNEKDASGLWSSLSTSF